jgi:hypothetical protein
MIGVPEPVPLDLPPGDAAGLEDVVEDVAGAGYWLTVLASDLAGPAASAPGWLGEDAEAAAAQVCAVAGIARGCSLAVGAAAHRLRRHHDLLVDVRRRVRALREEQQDDFAVAWQRLSRIQNAQLAVMVDAPERVAVIEELRAAEASRGRRHAALLEELADDAAATAGVLAESSAVVGGRGTRGDGDRVLAHLAAELPGWGERALATRGAQLADRLMHGWSPSSTVDELVRGGVVLAGSPVFATALLGSLGEEGVGLLLTSLGSNWLGGASPIAQLLAAAFGTAVPGAGRSRVDAVLNATYVRADDRNGSAAHIAAGMALVMAAGAAMPGGGLRPATVAEWARQMLLREQEQKLLTGVGEVPGDWPAGTSDPVALAMGILADRGNAEVAAALLADPAVWEALMNRRWSDGGVSVGEVVGQAARNDGAAGAQAIRHGLEVVGAGLFEGEPSQWTVSWRAVATLAPALAGAVAQQIAVVTDVLGLGLDGDLDRRVSDRLRGLGYVILEEGAARTVGVALHEWVRAQPVPADLAGATIPPQVVVPSAFLAVREYGQRLHVALHGFEEQARAQFGKAVWDRSFGAAAQVVGKTPVVGVGVGVANGLAAAAFGFDGRWDNGPDNGLHFDRDDAAAVALALAPASGAAREVFADQANAVFDRTRAALGDPRPPVSPEFDGWSLVGDAVVDTVRNETIQRGWKRARDLVG